ncbi:signal recognition particle 14 kDa protein isoform X1 [Amborella trichopoda]|uniref:signal recognition particle 14 kDa protein isoform X1 n=1 Tax=Amborella trichopoda TaxID=13333 RepID=UPI0009C15D61|nr:signal recognition particle 14 kDa protein isoform X1 [Amborella trichopoda]|eukprot:XP_020517838.1 signal recognition particle 14 kDa protein isoform X1 [Amborella trichopoda]
MFSTVSIVVLLQPDPFLNELTNMYERNREKGSVWVTLKRSSLKSKRKRKVEYATDVVDFRCLVRATDGKKTISTSLSAKDHLRFQASYATLLRAHMHALKKRERKDKKKAVSEVDKKLQQQVAAKKTPPKPKN